MGVCPKIASARAVGEPSWLKSSLRFCSAGKKPGVIELTRTPSAGPFPGQKTGQVQHRRFGGRISDHARDRQVAGHAGDVDDAALAPGDHGGSKFLAGQQHAANQVQIKIRLPVPQVDLLERALRANRHLRIVPAGGVDQNARAAQGLRDGPVRLGEARFLRCVRREKYGLAALADDVFGPGFSSRSVAAQDGHLCARPGHPFRQGAAQHPGRADHHCRLTR